MLYAARLKAAYPVNLKSAFGFPAAGKSSVASYNLYFVRTKAEHVNSN